MDHVLSYLRLVARAPRKRLVGFFLLVFAATCTDGIGLLLLLPFLEILTGRSTGVSEKFAEAFGLIGLPLIPETLLTCFLVIIAARSAIQFLRDLEAMRLQHHVIDQLRLQIFVGLINAEWSWVGSTRHSDHAALLNSEINRIGAALHFSVYLVVVACTSLVYLVVAAIMSPEATLAAGGCSLVLVGIMYLRDRKPLSRSGEQIVNSRAVFASLSESLAGLKTCKSLGAADRQANVFGERLASFRKYQVEVFSELTLTRHLAVFLAALLLAGYVALSLRVFMLSSAELFTLTLMFARLLPMFVQAKQHVNLIVQATPALKAAEDILARSKENAEPQPTPGRAPLAFPKVSIALDGVAFSYPGIGANGGEANALYVESLTLPVKSTSVIAGLSGAGKTTLVDLLAGLLPPAKGRLVLDGAPLEADQRLDWRAKIAYVLQEAYFFEGTLRSNFHIARPDATDEDMQRALQAASAGFVARLPLGLDTLLGDGGQGLSVGELRRLSLARALLIAPDLLILDEPTNALDPENVKAIEAAIKALHGETTIVIIGHTDFALRFADKLVVLRDGRIIAQGAPADIASQTGLVHA